LESAEATTNWLCEGKRFLMAARAFECLDPVRFELRNHWLKMYLEHQL
jgi:hypothetical protein